MVGDWPEAEELMIDAYAQLALKRGQFLGKSSLKTYLYTIARNLAIRHVRNRKRQRLIVDSPPVISAEQVFEREEGKRTLHRALGELPAQYSEVLYLLYFESLSHAQAATVLRKSKKQIDNLAQRGKAALKERLKKEEGWAREFD